VFSGGNGIAVDDGGMYWAAGVSGLPTIYECPTLGCDGGTQPTIITTLPTKNGLGACSLFDAGIYCASGQLSTGEGFYRCPRAPDDAGCTLVLTIDHPRGIETYRDGFLWAADPDGGGEVGHCINGAKPCVGGAAAPTLLAGPVPGANEVHGSIEKGLAVWTVDGRDGGVYAYQFNMQITSTVASVPHALHVAADPLRQLGLMSTPDGIYAFGPPPSTAGSPLLVVDGGMDNWYLVADVDREEAWCFQRLPGYPIYRFAYTVPDAGLEQIAHAPAGPNAATGFGPLLYWTDDFGGVTCLAK
jgi:hypothetical protein